MKKCKKKEEKCTVDCGLLLESTVILIWEKTKLSNSLILKK